MHCKPLIALPNPTSLHQRQLAEQCMPYDYTYFKLWCTFYIEHVMHLQVVLGANVTVHDEGVRYLNPEASISPS